MRTWWIVAIAACGSSGKTNLRGDAAAVPDAPVDAASDAPPDAAPDAPIDAPAVCNILAQTGCNVGAKCAWIIDQAEPTQIAHIGCAPVGTVAVGGVCGYTFPPGGYDNCVQGTVCITGVCEAICDQSGGAPQCDAMHACHVYYGFLGPPGQEAAGVCDALCDPLADNGFGGSAVGSGCLPGDGCYGFWNTTGPTEFTCTTAPPHGVDPPPPGSLTLFHRALCSTSSGCADPNGAAFLNGCAAGYMPLVTDDTTGANTESCMAFCAPADCSLGACGSASANLIGAAPHRCSGSDAAGTFNSGPDGDQCMYGWSFEVASDNTVHLSAYSNSLGICVDHSRYRLSDATGANISSTPWPSCDTLPLTATGTNCYGAFGSAAADLSGCTAQDFGCVSTTTGGVTTTPMRNSMHIARPRAPYHSRLVAR